MKTKKLILGVRTCHKWYEMFLDGETPAYKNKKGLRSPPQLQPSELAPETMRGYRKPEPEDLQRLKELFGSLATIEQDPLQLGNYTHGPESTASVERWTERHGGPDPMIECWYEQNSLSAGL